MFSNKFGVLCFALIGLFILHTFVDSSEKKLNYQVKYIPTALDNFNFMDNRSFLLRYLYSDFYVEDLNSSAIFFYTGNEGDIELFAQNTGLMWQLAKEFGAYVIFAEHRYYGMSLPFGNDTFNHTTNLQYLTVEQALEDFAHLIVFLQSDKYLPVIAFGGSYGGMLAAWLRMKYPHLVLGSLAASAPLWQFNGLTPCNIYSKITTSVFTSSISENCTINIQNSWNTFKNYSTTSNGRNEMNEVFKFCNPLKAEEDVNKFLDFLEDVYGNLAMANYPYGNNFLAPLPAYPVRAFCGFLEEIYERNYLLKAMQSALSIYTNYTGNSKCLNFESAYDTTLGGEAWNFQTCNQMVMPMCSYANESMFRNKEWNFKKYSEDCLNKFKLRPLLNDIVLRYGKKDLRFASNIIFSNGLLDPWSGGGVLHATNEGITIIVIPEGAHHLDLREANPSDPASVIQARREESKIIGQWIESFYKKK